MTRSSLDRAKYLAPQHRALQLLNRYSLLFTIISSTAAATLTVPLVKRWMHPVGDNEAFKTRNELGRVTLRVVDELIVNQNSSLGPAGVHTVSLEVVGGHRLQDLYKNLFLIFAAAKQAGLCLAPFHTGRTPGTFYAPAFNDHTFMAVPLETFAAFDNAPCRAAALPLDAPRFEMRAFNTSCSVGGTHPADRVTAQGHRVPAQPRAAWCLRRANGRLLSISVCVSVCSADGNSSRPVGEAIREAAEFVARSGSAGFSEIRSHLTGATWGRASLVLRLGRGHDKSIAGVTHYGKINTVPVRLSQSMAALGRSYVRGYLGCGVTRGRTLGASLRIAYGGGVRHTPSAFKEGCKSSFKKLGRWVAQHARHAPAGGGCPRRGYLATDWAAMADGWKNSTHRQAIEQCWEEVSIEAANASDLSGRATQHAFWTWPPDPRQLRALAARAAPELLQPSHGGKGPKAVDVRSFRDFFELAVLAQVDECYAEGHFGDIASQARSQFNKSACANGPTG